MAGSLWVSNGVRRKGTSFNEVQDLFVNQITTKQIYEKLHSAFLEDCATEILNDLIAHDFDIVGIVNQNKEVQGFISKKQLEAGVLINDHSKIDLNIVVTDSTPIHKLIRLLEKREFVFVLHGNAIDGIVTRADINKPIVRLYLFGIISLFEMHLNYWIELFHKSDDWKDVLKPERIQDAHKLQESKKQRNEALSLLACLQLCDKREILSVNKDFISQFQISKKRFIKLTTKVEDIRNELAHSQNTINAGMQWDDFVKIISELEFFLEGSDEAAINNESKKGE